MVVRDYWLGEGLTIKGQHESIGGIIGLLQSDYGCGYMNKHIHVLDFIKTISKKLMPLYVKFFKPSMTENGRAMSTKFGTTAP